MIKKNVRALIGILALSAVLTACNNKPGGNAGPQPLNDALLMKKDNIKENETINSEGKINIVAVVTGVDTDKKIITAKTIVLGNKGQSEYNFSQKEYALKYTGGTDIRNSYGTIISATQLPFGEIVNVEYDSIQDRITKITVSGDGFLVSRITGVNVTAKDKSISYNKNIYHYSDSLIVMDGDKAITISDIDENDVITIRGYDSTIYSITLDKGHGFIKFSGYSQFLGGYVEIGDKKVLKVEENMTIPVTEGTYKVIISKGNVVASKNITVERNKTAYAEFAEYLQEAKKQGSVKFNVSPEGARVFVDGVKIDANKSLELEYGVHTLTVVANGYDNYIQTFIVDEIYSTIDVDLGGKASEKTTAATTEKATEKETEKSTERTTEKETERQTTVLSTMKIY